MNRKKLDSSLDWKALAADVEGDMARTLYWICSGTFMTPEEVQAEEQRFEMEDRQVRREIELLEAEIEEKLARSVA